MAFFVYCCIEAQTVGVRMRALIILLGILAANISFAQTGPGGVGATGTVPLWLKADAGTSTTTNGQPVSSWSDMSGNNNNATQATASQQPLYTTALINGMPALFFDNIGSPGNDLMSVADADNLDNTSGLTILTVTRPISIDNSNARAIVSKRNDVGVQQAYTVFYYSGNHINVDIEGNDNRFTTPTTFVAGRDYVNTILYDGTQTAANRSKVYVNENLDITTTETATTISNMSSPVTIGSMNLSDGRPFGGYIAEVIILRKALNQAERIIVHNYLFAKYGLSSTSVPATVNDLYAGDDPANGNYDFEVGGLGNEASGSNNNVAASATGGLGMGVTGGFQAGDYMIYGHASGPNTAQLTDVGGMTGTNNARWSRIWYVDVTNTGGPQFVNMFFDMSDGGHTVTPVTASNYVLLSRTGQSGNWTEVTTATSITGDQLNFINVVVSADAYYTLGSKDYLASPLPITLVNFDGEYNEKGVELTWTTSNEHNNDHFTIGRSADGKNFSVLTTVRGAGSSPDEVTYNALDPAPFSDRTYYRLSQTDFDGKTTHLKTIVVKTAERVETIEVIPNPSNGNFWFELPEGVINSELKIFNSAGASVPFNFSTLGSRVTINAQSLPKGFYILKLVSDRGMHAAKFVIE